MGMGIRYIIPFMCFILEDIYSAIKTKDTVLVIGYTYSIILQTFSRKSTQSRTHGRLFRLVENVGKMALSAVLTVVHSSHEDTSTAL